MDSINIKLIPMEYSVKGVSCCNEDGSYTIIINSKISYEQQLEAYRHELRHIAHDDYRCDDIDWVELKTHYNNN